METALKEPYSLIITEETANKFFGRENPVGETMLFNKMGNYRITGVLAEPGRGRYAFELQRLMDSNLGKNLHGRMSGTQAMLDLVYFPFIGQFLKGLPCSNYIILSIARSLKRTKEIGLRKVIGAKRKDIILLLLCESFVVTLIAMVISCFLFFYRSGIYRQFWSGNGCGQEFLTQLRSR